MLQSKLTAIKNYILEHNTYFAHGYDNAWLDEANGGVSLGEKVLFPNDNLGNYFYLRMPNQIRFDYSAAARIDDCSNTPSPTGEVVLVASIKGGSPDKLITNLLNTIGSYNAELRFSSAVYQSEVVVQQEMRGFKKETVNAALARIGKNKIVSITFAVSTEFRLRKVTSGCILNPCEC